MITLLLLILAIALIVIAVRLRRRRQRRRVMIVKLMAIIVLLIAAFYIVKYQSLPSRSSNRDGKVGSEEPSQNVGWIDSAVASDLSHFVIVDITNPRSAPLWRKDRSPSRCS